MTLDIKATLRERGLRQKEIAARLGVSEPTFSVWAKAMREGQHARVPAEKAKRLADALGVPFATIRPDLFVTAEPPAPAKAA
jgi:transcriptional regulator with XRE-family HTH domain